MDHHGKCRLKFIVYDTDEQIKVDLMAKKCLVEPSNSFFEEINDIEGIQTKLISENIEVAAERKPGYKQFAKT